MQNPEQQQNSIPSSQVEQEIAKHREDGWKELDHERLLFASTYIASGYCHIEAAKEIGIPISRARRFLNDPLVRAYLRDYSDNVSATSHITTDFLRVKLMELLPKLEGKEEVEVFVPQMAASVAVKKFHPAELLRALDALGKHIGFNEDLEDDDKANAIETLLRRAMENKRRREEVVIEGEAE